MTITNELEERLNGMCPVARASTIGTAIKAAEAGIVEFNRWKNNRVLYGMIVTNQGTTPSSQASGAVPPEVLVDTGIGAVVAEGDVWFDESGNVDLDISFDVPVLAIGQHCEAALVCSVMNGGNTTMVAVWGAPSDDYPSPLPSDADIKAWLIANGYSPNYVRVASHGIFRAGDVQMTELTNNLWRDW